MTIREACLHAPKQGRETSLLSCDRLETHGMLLGYTEYNWAGAAPAEEELGDDSFMWLNDAMENSLMGLNIQVRSLMTTSQWALYMDLPTTSHMTPLVEYVRTWSPWQLLIITP